MSMSIRNLQCTMSIIRLLTDGGTPFEAIHKYGPICKRLTRVIFSSGPSTLRTETRYKRISVRLYSDVQLLTERTIMLKKKKILCYLKKKLKNTKQRRIHNIK